MKRILTILFLFVPLFLAAQEVQESDTIVSDTLTTQVSRLGIQTYDDLSLYQKPFDLQTPSNIQTETVYDPLSGNYVIHSKIGDIDISTPFLMSSSEYLTYTERQMMSRYWQQKLSEQEHDNERKFDITDMKFNIGPADKVFGPGGVQLKLQGSAELMFGFKHQFIDNPTLTRRSQNNNIFDFNEKIQVSANAKVGDRLNFNMNYNTEASFNFDTQNLKLNYKGKEDDIIQSLEAGNVSMSLNSQLISGSQALFGIKANMKFGKLTVQALLSQQKSTTQSVSSQGGAQTTKFEITADSYDENRHFFLSYFFRDNYEAAMQQLPYIASGVTINKIEVWVTNKRGQYENARNVVAFVDLGEAKKEHIQSATITPTGTSSVPFNKANSLYADLNGYSAEIRDIQQTNAALQAYFPTLVGGEEYEKVESARLLSSSEYTLNSALGYISLRAALNQDEVLCVAYEYTYAGQVYQVGEFSTDASDDLRAPNALILKMLKGSNNSPVRPDAARFDAVSGEYEKYGTWHLMMKNVYSIGAMQMTQDKFELYVNYRNDSVGTELQYLPEGAIKGKQLLRVMNLDRLDQKNNPYADGRFDYVEGYTAISSNGRIIFPVLEPFGSHLRKMIDNDQIANKYVFQELYDSTLVIAQEMSEKNKFTITGKYKGSSGSEIRLNAMNVPRGSVKVTAGGATLVENVDYTVDYTMGVVTILNQSILESGTSVDVQLENQSMFSMQRKSLMGVHLDYAFTKDFVLGGTLMHLTERPLTTKVNTGSEPISNTIWGVNLSWKKEFMWLTNALDKLPWTTATQPSSFQINAEFAQLIPGHTRDVTKAGLAYVDDFEATKTNIDIHHPAFWHLASTPSRFAEASLSNDINYGKSRALLAWYNVDPIFGNPRSSYTPRYIRDNLDMLSDHRTRIVNVNEIYPNREQMSNVEQRLTILNLAFYPTERGPYNIVDSVIDNQGRLTNPETRWGGIMRKIDNTDFDKANIEYIEFWLMDPFLTNPDPAFHGGQLYINLGDISEDILRDGKKSFEHGLPVSPTDIVALDTTVWGRMPRTTSTVTAFSNEAGARQYQDVGLNGLSTDQEFAFEYKGRKPYADYVSALRQKVNGSVLSQWENDPFSPLNDPAGDNYHYYRGDDYDEAEVSILDRYKHYNGTEGNSPVTADGRQSYSSAATLLPDIEDVNNDNTLNEYEKYYEYRIDLTPEMMQVGKQHIAQRMVATNVMLENGTKEDVVWYQFKIPVREYDNVIGSIRNFKSIRFVRMYLTGFQDETFLRFASFDLVRGEWRGCTKPLYATDYPVSGTGSMDVQAINIEESASRTPVNYVLPPGVSRQTDPGQAQAIPQNEQAMVLRVHNLEQHDARAVYKNTAYDMRQYKHLQMFVHAEAIEEDPDLQDEDLSCFIRLGSDMTANYYEYEIPLRLTQPGIYNDSETDRAKVWLPQNMFDFAFSVLTDAKLQRNKAKRAGNPNVNNLTPFVIYDEASGKPKNRITVMGNPTIEDVENIMIGIRNNGPRTCSGEVWVNELRMSEFNEEGGVAAMANASLSLSDIGQVNVAGRIETAGYGSIESNVLDRNMDNHYQVSVSAAFEAGRLFPEKAQIQLPLYVAYTNETLSPKYDPLDTDIKLSETLDTYTTKEERDSVRQMSNTVQTSTNFTISSAKVNIHSKKRNMFYDPANFSLSYAFSEQNQHTPELEKNYTKTHKGAFTYNYSFSPKPWEPFKDAKKLDKAKWLKEFNIYYLPQSWAFSTDMNRQFNHMKMRDFNTGADSQMDLTFSKDFAWNRQFDFKYDLTKNMKFSFQTAMNSTVDEGYYTPEIIKDYAFTNDYYEAWKDTIQRSLRHWGSPFTYRQVFTASWSVPFNRISWLDWVTANASYNANYNWNRTATTTNTETNLGNTIASLRNWQVDGQLNFENLYNKSDYWKKMKNFYNQRGTRRKAKEKTFTQTYSLKADSAIVINHKLGSDRLRVTAEDANGKTVRVKTKTVNANTIEVSAKADYENLKLTIVTLDPNQKSAAEITGDMFAYFGTMVRRVQITYRQNDGITMPGFAPEAGFMGQRRQDNLYAPGFDFAFGFFGNNFVDKAKQNGWLSLDTAVVQPATITTTSDLDIKLTLEPFPGFKVQVNGKRYMASSNSIIYTYDHLQENMTGSYNITQIAMLTAFDRIGDVDNNYATRSFTRFLDYRDQMAARVQSRYDELTYPDEGFIHEYTILGGRKYSKQYGTVNRNSADVIVPAFLAAYTKRDINRVGFNPFLNFLHTMPNWSVTFDGLGRLPWMRDHFRSVNLTHAYVCKYAISSYTSYSTWVGAAGNDKMLGFVRDVTTDVPMPSSAYDISAVSITEQFSPLIGVNVAMKNSLTAKVEYRKQRNITMNVTSVQLNEGSTNELVIGVGYTIKDFDVILKLKSQKQTKVKNDLKLNVDVSYKDVKTLLRKVEENITQASSGNKVFAIKVSADYVLSQKVNLQFFYDHQTTTPLISTSYPTKMDNAGINIKLMLTR